MANLPYITRPLIWMGDSKRALSSFAAPVKRVLGFALRQVQNGETPPQAKPLPGLGPGVHELRASGPDNTYRVVYVLKLAKGVYVLDAFVKKSKSGKAIPREARERIVLRLKRARELDAE